MDQQSLLIVIPTYNERENIVRLVDRLFELYPFVHVLVMDDGSPDGTADAVRDAQGRHADRLHLHVRQGKGGRGSAVLEGFRFGLDRRYDLIMEMDADFSHEPAEIGSFLKMIPSCDIVVGSRYLPESEIREWGWKRSFFSWLANHYARFVLGIPLSDYTNGYRCYTRQAVQALDMDSIDAKGYVVLSEVAYQLHRKGLRFREVPTVFVNRRRGASNLSLHEVQEAFFSVLRVRSERIAQHARQASAFIIAGILGAFVDLASLTALVEIARVAPQTAFFPSTLLAVLSVFVFNKFITFRSHDEHVIFQLSKFIVVYAAAILLNIAIASLLFWSGLHYLVSKAVAIVIIAIWNYYWSHSFIFRTGRKQS